MHFAAYGKNSISVILALDTISDQMGQEAMIAKVNQQNSFGETPLHYLASGINNFGGIRALIAAGANYDIKNNEGQSSLDNARLKNSRRIDEVIDHYRRYNLPQQDRLECVLIKMSIIVAAKLESLTERTLDERNYQFIQDLFRKNVIKAIKLVSDSSAESKVKVAERLMLGTMELVVKIIAIDKESTGPSRHLKSQIKNSKIAMQVLPIMVDFGVDVNIKTINNLTALHLAAYLKLESVTNDLIAKGANLEARDINGQSPSEIILLQRISSAAESYQRAQKAAASAIQVSEATTPELKVKDSIIHKTATERLQDFMTQPPKGIKPETLQNFIADGADINAKVRSGASILHQTIICNAGGEATKFLLARDDLEFSVIFEELSQAIKKGDKQLVAVFLSEEKIIQKFAVQEKLIIGELRKINHSHNREEIKKKINVFESAVAQKNADLNVDKTETISKKERERRRKEANKIKAQESKSVAQEKALHAQEFLQIKVGDLVVKSQSEKIKSDSDLAKEIQSQEDFAQIAVLRKIQQS